MSSERPTTQGLESRSEPFLYIATNGENIGEADGGATPAWNLQGASHGNSEQREKEAFDRGMKEGEARSRAAGEQELVAVKAFISAALEKFQAEREAYFSRIEPEVVQLALAIARKILHREAQMDPLLLAGMVRVALEKVDRSTHIRLRANPEDIHFWKEHFAEDTGGQAAPELVGDPQLKRGECALETEMGNTSISLDTHLKEIEQGFL